MVVVLLLTWRFILETILPQVFSKLLPVPSKIRCCFRPTARKKFSWLSQLTNGRHALSFWQTFDSQKSGSIVKYDSIDGPSPSFARCGKHAALVT